MKREIIEVDCDNCQKSIVHPAKDNTVTIILEGTEFDSDWCDKCRAALKAKLVPDELTCTQCGYIAKSERGLRQHKVKQSHD